MGKYFTEKKLIGYILVAVSVEMVPATGALFTIMGQMILRKPTNPHLQE